MAAAAGGGRVISPLKWHGGKHYLASKIVALMPPHVHYVEPFAGGLSVLLAKEPEGVSEVVNDLHGDLTNFWRVLRHPDQFPEFLRAVQATPFSEAEYGRALDGTGEYTAAVGRAWAFFVACRQSLAGRMDTFAPLSRTRTRRGMNEQASAWLNAVDGLPAVHGRLKRVVILNRDALDVIRQQDGPNTLFYLDPPYLHSTRATTGEYAHEMTEFDHDALCATIAVCEGKVMLSGYPNEMYDKILLGWKRHEFELPNNAAGGESKRRMTECVWANFD
jgi:DNA adenine methylase